MHRNATQQRLSRIMELAGLQKRFVAVEIAALILSLIVFRNVVIHAKVKFPEAECTPLNVLLIFTHV